ncbi:hypothetical protein PUNSTDRAFT_54339 [Punctularia strigosozonata HHB-11173 SS5]|uniref:uncharacterized protein n=1 Tax=Punctularia strigosozonata (strain HHB-11173) TaxID=741275 RepID=UPI00044168F7|nr:uncharacterized protein PUNSTDRAFT_54339 [Punctularia strigosozonata HHB-11173 SS5]EIN06050.1 hypothetical protein PUNSTDRAFT_54339 [Punctularia strigosozonata HHB-11173 SS5]
MFLSAGLLFGVLSLASNPVLGCTTQSQPNPIFQQYLTTPTGTNNGTTVIIPIDLALARSIVPSQYPILTQAYQSLLPDFPQDKYPMYLHSILDHDIRELGINLVPDFTQAGLRFPFVDRLNDGTSSFVWELPLLLSVNLVAVLGSISVDETHVGSFEPSCDPYAAGSAAGETYFRAWNGVDQLLGKQPSFAGNFTRVDSQPYPIGFYKNITNQPLFGSVSTTTCDNFITLFNSSVTAAPFAPVPVKGTLTVLPPFFPTATTFTDVFGLQMDNAFVEHTGVECSALKGYSGTGPGD